MAHADIGTKFLKKYNGTVNDSFQITGSKSESNRLLILQALYPSINISNLSNSDDTNLMQNALKSTEKEINIGHAGTTMRFLTSYFAVKPNSEIILTGSARMQERPIKILVDALRSLGAKIEYVKNDGFPPLKITGSNLTANKVKIDGSVSSQYISSLLLIAPTLPDGLTIEFEGKITSIPYIQMTLSLLNDLGVSTNFEGQFITVNPTQEIKNTEFTVESDWSSASYSYGLVALTENGKLDISSYKQNSLQGDSVLQEIYKEFGVTTTFNDHTITLEKVKNFTLPKRVEFDLVKAPDIAQTIAVTAFGLGVECHMTGLHTLKIKETDRIIALYNELTKLGATIEYTDETLTVKAFNGTINSDVHIATYNDHRMAMAFAPLLLKTNINIDDAGVVSKSYPSFWDDFERFQ
ncbi:3-phosphoshikimate 1-carboxyvinyltransferase [Wenyingzhuangia fucanilytica]|uniref:3-phosphoshikimate 1-carboxyvinyltransferase n=1 Tax=Wenyingzhuangia fucanilytica TaxID=1790137 RepID=A0A1B1Y8C8_9FLAO|nr:3-phosphoshikimate 1-carboxyvinyltransferase [Wenyingzhuangia fucanilytica]ANW97004.1 3-phosphoshikimate 1-carboxyvinyltransferase [Wenyingzhuangia fucanilytica]